MIEKIIIDYLSKELGITCYAEKQVNTKRYVLIEKIGGGKKEHLTSAIVAIQSYDSTLYKAAELNELVKTAMFKMPNVLNEISKMKLNSDYNFTDTEIKHYRYQAIFEIIYYMEEMK